MRPADGQRHDSFCFFSRVSSRNVRSLRECRVASSSNGFAAGAFLSRPSVSFASLRPTLFRFRDGHFLGDRRGGVVPTLGRASASERFAGGGSACGAVRGATRLPVASGRGFEERISGRGDTHEVLLHPVRHERRTTQREGVLIVRLHELLRRRVVPELIEHRVVAGTGRRATRIASRDGKREPPGVAMAPNLFRENAQQC